MNEKCPFASCEERWDIHCRLHTKTITMCGPAYHTVTSGDNGDVWDKGSMRHVTDALSLMTQS